MRWKIRGVGVPVLVLWAGVWCDAAGPDDGVFLHVLRDGLHRAEIPLNADVLYREEVDRSVAYHAGGLLELLPSADVANAAGVPGGQQSLRLRFAPADQTLILRDGVPLNGFASSVWNLANTPVHSIERVEVLYGAASAMFGANAAAGVVNIVTRSPGEGPSVGLTLGYGAHETPAFDLAFENRWDAVGVRGDVGYRTSAGWRQNSRYTGLDTGVKAVAAYSTGWFRQTTVAFRGRVSDTGVPGPAPIPYFSWDGVRERDAASPRATQRDENTAVDIAVEHPFGSLRAGYADDFLRYEDPDWFTDTRTRTRRATFGGTADIPGTGVTVTLDAQQSLFLREDRSAFAMDPVDRALGNIGIGVRWHFTAGGLGLIPAVRCDMNSEYGTRAHPQLLATYRVGAVRLSAAAGTGWRAPTFLDLYWPASMWTSGNPGLEPEQSLSVDLGAAFESGPVSVAVNPFMRITSDMIRWGMDPVTYVYMPMNSDEATVYGAELTVDLVPAPSVRLTARTLVAEARIRDASLANSEWLAQAYAPDLSGTLGAVWRLPAAFTLSGDLRWAAEQYAQDGGRGLRLPAFALLDIRCSKKFGEWVEIFASVRDVLDQKGVDRAAMDFFSGEWTAYPQAGRSVEVGIRTSFGL